MWKKGKITNSVVSLTGCVCASLFVCCVLLLKHFLAGDSSLECTILSFLSFSFIELGLWLGKSDLFV
jgi:hypothetical protein